MDTRDLMVLWREDLKGTSYGRYDDARPPTRVLPTPQDDFAWKDNLESDRRAGVRIQARIAMRLREFGYGYSEIDNMLGLSRNRAYALINYSPV